MTTHTTVRFLHDVGQAVWFGGSLMGATGLNGASSELPDLEARARAATAGWSRWAPVAGAAVAAHVIGAVGLTVTDRERIYAQKGVRASSSVKAALTLAGVGVSAWSAVLNRKMAAAGDVPVAGATDPAATTPVDVTRTQSQLKAVQYLNPLVSGAIIAAAAWQSEQQRTAQVVPGVLRGLPGGLLAVPAAGALGAAAFAVARRQKSAAWRDAPPTPVVVHPATLAGPEAVVASNGAAPDEHSSTLHS